ncbi:hypothetical protein AYM40_16105 [Paraburkholderia phytofirmans OLGA172]|uniref:DarT domain-containing protein n=1 Tax=Paraburkholderia phytofirmans OLGA172 TaxID=1417228 RepID=A0A160FPX2_9BURK|nr:DarT ssDNA thymidine ADP-ribosyltransferase family protein [Paraburkholderia phytofirmans]ANB74761.1 hypothetical protein AYM40_16105 [Paraburkholderia phytofirmans OLGA172]
MANPIEEFARERGIKFLMHFTKLTNLGAILQRGLVTRDVLVLEGNVDALNDQYRYDHTDAICLSIGFPNYRMFYRLRQENQGTDWVVVAVNPSALWELPCAFCSANAAAGHVSAIPIEDRKTIAAFRGMYADYGDKTRAQLGIKDGLPTNPQAEVLMLRGVPPSYILGVWVQSTTMQAMIKELYPGLQVVAAPGLFSYRSDYAHWKANA